mmetsp:Transcript_9484/g.13833  ORF Transcript_9484/g.13833 Transcript_9484/m.13833 type:complete len:80 (+) Transcript_9484:172-411(+)
MSDEENGVDEVMEPQEEAPVAEVMNLRTAVQEVLRQALMSDQLARGAREAVKALDRGDVSDFIRSLLALQCLTISSLWS